MSGIRIRRHRAVRHRTTGTPITGAGGAAFLGAIETESRGVTGGAVTTVTSASFTPAAGELLVVKAVSSVYPATPSTISGGGLTWTKLFTAGVNLSTVPMVFWTAPVTASSTMSVGVTFDATGSDAPSAHGVFVVERFIGGHLAATPTTSTLNSDTAVPYQTTITTVGTNSVVTWMEADYTGKNGTVTYVGAPTQTYRYQEATAGVLSFSTAYQPAAAAGAQTYGMSAPTGQTATLGAVEILAGAP